jgi:hypothetical protein
MSGRQAWACPRLVALGVGAENARGGTPGMPETDGASDTYTTYAS